MENATINLVKSSVKRSSVGIVAFSNVNDPKVLPLIKELTDSGCVVMSKQQLDAMEQGDRGRTQYMVVDNSPPSLASSSTH